MTIWEPDDPIDFAASIDRHRRWGEDPINVVHDCALYRVAGGAPYRARQRSDGSIEVEGEIPGAALSDLRRKLAEDLPRRPLDALAGSDDRVAGLLERFPGYRPPIIAEPFESLVTSVTAQQVNLAWATTTRRRFVHLAGRPHLLDGVAVWEFPEPAAVARLDIADLRALQFTTRKAEYIVGLARVALEGGLDDLQDLSDGEIIERLIAIRGIGRWTADWFLARCLARPAAVAAGDLGVRKAVSYSYHRSETILSEEVVRSTAETWGDAANWTAHLLLETL